MEGVPSKSRNLQMNLLMGKLYRNSAQTRAAISCYKDALRFVKLDVFINFSVSDGFITVFCNLFFLGLTYL